MADENELRATGWTRRAEGERILAETVSRRPTRQAPDDNPALWAAAVAGGGRGRLVLAVADTFILCSGTWCCRRGPLHGSGALQQSFRW